MQFVADLHLHSKYSRAVSQQMMLPQMARWASLKGLDIISASDFTHPLWFRELKSQLKESSEGLYALKSQIQNHKSQSKTLFLLSTEISSIYKQGEKLRRIHNLVFAPNLETVEKINKEFTKRAFNLIADGRPIIGLSSKDLLELLLSIDKNILLIPCHVWTPHFGMYGSASGFDSIEESFGNLSDYIYGIETGLSSDPQMNWQIEELRTRSILSFSDAHSGAKMGREATVFAFRGPVIPPRRDTSATPQITYNDITSAIKRDPKGSFEIQYTVEFYPEEGKYHYSGHRNCKVVRGPQETRKDGNTCPICKRRLTEGVLYRLEQLSNENLLGKVETKISQSGIKWYTDTTKNHPPFVKLVPLNEIIAEAFSSTVSSQKVKDAFDNLCENLGSEIEVLLKTPLSQIEKMGGAKLSEGIDRVRRGNIVVDPGYDGEYGRVKIWNGGDTITQSVEEKQESQLDLQF
ncbi:MAG: endonuclease Q family protein [Patescibacteria group bacterium]